MSAASPARRSLGRVARKLRSLIDARTQDASIILIPVAEATPLLRGYRLQFDAGAAAGMPEHVTLLYPFLPPPAVDESVTDRLAELFAAVPPFDFSLHRLGWFEQDVLYVTPEPAGPFAALTARIVDEFGILPYKGAFADSIPHITVAQYAGYDTMRGIAEEIQDHLPIAATAREVWLMTSGAGGRWKLRDQFPLGS